MSPGAVVIRICTKFAPGNEMVWGSGARAHVSIWRWIKTFSFLVILRGAVSTFDHLPVRFQDIQFKSINFNIKASVKSGTIWSKNKDGFFIILDAVPTYR